MNEKLIYKDGKALIISDDNKIKEIDYYDNLNKVLQKENLIEKLDAKKFYLEEEIIRDEENIYTKKDLVSSMVIALLSPAGIYFFLGSALDLGRIVNTTIFGDINLFSLITILIAPIVGIVGITVIAPMFIKNKELNCVINGKKTTLKYLKKEIEKTNEKLIELKKDKTCTKNNEDMFVLNIKDDINTDEIKNNLNIYYNLGYYKKKNEKKESDSTICYPLLYGEILEDNDKDLPKRRIKKR